MGISIFAKEAFLNINPSQPLRLRTKPIKGGHVQRVSSLIRGDQIVERIGAKYNPVNGYQDDVCIYVKPMVRKGEDFKFEGRKAYLDIVDGHNLGQLLNKHPEVGCIVCSLADERTMKNVIPNEVVYIPQHHCNFNREIRWSEGNVPVINKIGVIGAREAFSFIPDSIRKGLHDLNIELIEFSTFHTRQDIIDFYKSIDLQLVWRPYRKILSNPLKIVNASSFGIPTIALDESAFKEVRNCYWAVESPEEFLMQVKLLKESPSIMIPTIHRCIEKAKFYHIDNIAKMYKELDK
jgi:hypothetical protein